MTLNNIKAIFLDMDGTILHEDNKASIKTKSVIDELREKGYKIFLATGRSYTEIDQLVLNLKLMESSVLMVRVEK